MQEYSLGGPADLGSNSSPSIVTSVPEAQRPQVLICVKRASPCPQMSSEALRAQDAKVELVPTPLGWCKRNQCCSPTHLGQFWATSQNLQGLLILKDQQQNSSQH